MFLGLSLLAKEPSCCNATPPIAIHRQGAEGTLHKGLMDIMKWIKDPDRERPLMNGLFGAVNCHYAVPKCSPAILATHLLAGSFFDEKPGRDKQSTAPLLPVK
jgi:hypothetical protein